MDYFLLTNNLTKATGKLDNLIDGTCFCMNSSIKEWSINMPLLENGDRMFHNNSELISFSSTTPNLSKSGTGNGLGMFSNCKKLTRLEISLDNLSNGTSMFYGCSSLKNWSIELPRLSNAYVMFQSSGIENFNVDLPSLKQGNGMFFACNRLKTFISNACLLKDGSNMFNYCSKLNYFSCNLEQLKIGGNRYGDGMFNHCSELKYFHSSLSALTNADYMFNTCKLNLESLLNISNSIRDLTKENLSGNITIGMSVDIKDFQETADALALIRSKGWTATEQYN